MLSKGSSNLHAFSFANAGLLFREDGEKHRICSWACFSWTLFPFPGFSGTNDTYYVFIMFFSAVSLLPDSNWLQTPLEMEGATPGLTGVGHMNKWLRGAHSLAPLCCTTCLFCFFFCSLTSSCHPCRLSVCYTWLSGVTELVPEICRGHPIDSIGSP